MTIIEDTRQQAGKHKNIAAYMERNGIEMIQRKLDYGDYMIDGSGYISVDTKQGLGEVYSNCVQQHNRFRTECAGAKAKGIQLVILVEQSGIADIDAVHTWNNPRVSRWYTIKKLQSRGKCANVKLPKSPPMNSASLEKAMKSMTEYYGVRWEFCEKKDTGKRIVELLKGGENSESSDSV